MRKTKYKPGDLLKIEGYFYYPYKTSFWLIEAIYDEVDYKLFLIHPTRKGYEIHTSEPIFMVDASPNVKLSTKLEALLYR